MTTFAQADSGRQEAHDMSWNPGRLIVRAAMRASLVAPLLAASALAGVGTSAHAGSLQLTSLVTDDQTVLTGLGFPAAAHVDPNLINPWGVSFTPTSPFWVSDNGAGVSTLYTAAGVQVSPPSPVTIFTPPGQTPGTATPTGQVFNSDTTRSSSRTAPRREAPISSLS